MSFFDRLRPKWKHTDPIIRENAVRELTNQSLLEKIAVEDADERVRLAAVQTLTDQPALARLARGNDALALAAAKGLNDSALLIDVALTSESRAVRELAVDRIDDAVALHRIATSDTDARIRAKARKKRMGPDATRDFLREELSKLQLARRKAEQMAEICGSLNDVCSALIGDGRFSINGGLEPEASKNSETAANNAAAEAACAQFLAFKRESMERPDGQNSNVFFEIKVWRTDQDTFECTAEEKRLALVHDAGVWSRVSNGVTSGAAGGSKVTTR